MTTVNERAKKIKLLIADVDGVLTDGKINLFFNAKGEIDEFTSFAAIDGLGTLFLNYAGIPSAIITGRAHATTASRAKGLGIKYCYQGFLDKTGPFKDILARENITPEQVAYIGDDIIDLPLLSVVGLAVCPADARPETKKYCHYVAAAAGGGGVLRETADLILKARGKWDELERLIKEDKWQRAAKCETQVFKRDGSR